MRIGFISLHTSPLAEPGRADAGGMNVVVNRTACQLAELGHEVEMFTRRSDPEAPAVTEVREGVRLILLDAGPAAPLAKSEMERAIEPFSAELRRVLSGGAIGGITLEPLDVIHSHHWFSGVAALPVARELGFAHIQSYHSVAAPKNASSLALGEPSESEGRIDGERRVGQGSDLVVAVSHIEADTIVARYRVPDDKVRIARPGVGVEFFTPRTCPPPEQPYLLFAARLQPLKGADLALEMFAKVRERLNGAAGGAGGADAAGGASGALERYRGLRLVLAGAASDDHDAYPDELRAQAERLGVADAVDFAGACSREKLACLMREAALFVLPSWSETFGLVALESQASGVPVIGWLGAGGLAEAVAPGGLLMESRDADDWAEAIVHLLGDDKRLAAAGESAREFALEHTWRHTATDLVCAYQEVLA